MIGRLIPTIESICSKGAAVMLKWDGERKVRKRTVAIWGPGEYANRVDSEDIEEGLSRLICDSPLDWIAPATGIDNLPDWAQGFDQGLKALEDSGAVILLIWKTPETTVRHEMNILFRGETLFSGSSNNLFELVTAGLDHAEDSGLSS